MHLLKVYELTHTCTTNADAVALDVAVRKLLHAGESVKLDFHGITGMTTSFLNSSFGAWVEDFGFEALKGRIVLTNYTPFIAKFIRTYMDNCRFQGA
ncbi:MAG: DUF4325 domain-containing protein [Bacteroidetes bacterium]|nr:DUF4325 domain-containing protein [Bacteroidota bacterium]